MRFKAFLLGHNRTAESFDLEFFDGVFPFHDFQAFFSQANDLSMNCFFATRFTSV